MKDIRVIDLIIEDINKFLIKERISPVKIDFIQKNGVPCKCYGDISDEKKQKVNEYIEKYKDKYEICKVVINYHYGNTSNMEKELGKSQLGKRIKNFIRNEAEIMEMLKTENILKLK